MKKVQALASISRASGKPDTETAFPELGSRKQILYLIIIMVGVALLVAATSIWVLYEAAFDQQRARLVETAQSQARFIEAVGRFNEKHPSIGYPGGPAAATLSQITDAHERYKGFGKTGEFTLARRQGANIVFLMSHRHLDLGTPRPVPWKSTLAEPMRRALKGISGTVIGLDYRNVWVLAAHEPVPQLSSGIVAKMDLAEIRAPFIRAAIASGAGTILIILLGVGVFRHVSAPIVQRERAEQALRNSEERFRRVFENSGVGMMIRNLEDRSVIANDAFLKMSGYSIKELQGLHLNDITHLEDREENKRARERFLDREIDVVQVTKRLTRKDGQIIWVNNDMSAERDADGHLVHTIDLFQDITERKLAEEEAKENSALLETTFQNLAQGFAVYDADKKLVAFNQEYVEMAGFPPNFIHLGIDRREVLRFLAKENNYGKGDIDRWVEERISSMEAGEGLAVERQRSDGKHYIFTHKPMPDGGIVATYTDITELKQVEREATEKSRLLEGTFANMTQGIAIFGADHTLVASNPQYADILGVPQDFICQGMNRRELIRFRAEQGHYGACDTEALVADHLARAGREEAIERTLPGGRSYFYERTPMPDGSYLSTVTDITERKQAEREIAEQSQLLKATFENMVQGIAVFDAEHTLVAFNPQFAEIIGLLSDKLYIGMNRRDILRYQAQQGHFYDDDDDVDGMVSQRLARAQEPRSRERTLPNGRSYLYERVTTPDGGYVTTYTDITERKRAEEQLQQAQKMEAVGQLTGGIAHDFNNLLAVSLGNVELAEEVAREGGDVGPFLETVKRATERGASLTSQLLAFSRKQTLFPQTIDAGDLLAGMTGLLRSALEETIEIKVTGADDLWPCKADPHQLESAVLNLALNARDAMESGGTLTIETTNAHLDDDYAAAQADMEPGEYVQVAVNDTGIGMAQDVIDHAFDPFFTTKGVGEGSGLGLSMVYGFAKQSGGHVTVYSEEGKGTTIRLYLPRSDAAEERSGEENRENTPQAHGEIVLVVEDDPEVRTLAVALLSSFGYEILEAADGSSALKALDSMPKADLLFTDVILPGGISGPELAAEVRERFPGMAVLYTSGYTDLANVDQSAFAEGTELLQKPYRKVDLARKVRLVLDGGRA